MFLQPLLNHVCMLHLFHLASLRYSISLIKGEGIIVRQVMDRQGWQEERKKYEEKSRIYKKKKRRREERVREMPRAGQAAPVSIHRVGHKKGKKT